MSLILSLHAQKKSKKITYIQINHFLIRMCIVRVIKLLGGIIYKIHIKVFIGVLFSNKKNCTISFLSNCIIEVGTVSVCVCVCRLRCMYRQPDVNFLFNITVEFVTWWWILFLYISQFCD